MNLRQKMFTLSTFELFYCFLVAAKMAMTTGHSNVCLHLLDAGPTLAQCSVLRTQALGKLAGQCSRTASGVCCVIAARFGGPFFFVTLFTIQRAREKRQIDQFYLFFLQDTHQFALNFNRPFWCVQSERAFSSGSPVDH